ncbi:MAG TPA: hypothetical protein VEK08_09175 [Planctomycetota bacterium]|nr:hypothetical protein [Planctomycetota bacterium]
MARCELRGRNPAAVKAALDAWVAGLDRTSPEWRHHQLEALLVYRGIGVPKPELLRELQSCDKPQSRMAGWKFSKRAPQPSLPQTGAWRRRS